MASPPSQEVDDINKKLIILPRATSEGLARAMHCSLPILHLLIHLTLSIPTRPLVGQGEREGWVARCLEEREKRHFALPHVQLSMSPTRDRLVLIVLPFFGTAVLVMAGTYGGFVMCECLCECIYIYVWVCLFALVLLFPVVISEGKVIRCLIEGSVNQTAPDGVCVCMCMCESPAISSALAYTCTQTCTGYQTESQDVKMKTKQSNMW